MHQHGIGKLAPVGEDLAYFFTFSSYFFYTFFSLAGLGGLTPFIARKILPDRLQHPLLSPKDSLAVLLLHHPESFSGLSFPPELGSVGLS
jgi:hypothetical protein